MNPLQITALISLFLSLISVSEGDLKSQTRFVPDTEASRIWIEGDSNVNSFDCKADQYQGEAIQNQDEESNTTNNLTLNVEIKVAGFDCGKQRMNKDLRDALKEKDYPNITFVFLNAEPVESTSDNPEFLVFGNLTVAGVTNEIRFNIFGEMLQNGSMRAIGNKQIRMTDYNVAPPTAMFGLVKVDNELTVHFDLVAKQI